MLSTLVIASLIFVKHIPVVPFLEQSAHYGELVLLLPHIVIHLLLGDLYLESKFLSYPLPAIGHKISHNCRLGIVFVQLHEMSLNLNESF
jgi:hypothetical protein